MVKSRIKVAKKGKRWLKGQSSNSNPESKHFRSLAQHGYFRPMLESKSKDSSLTISALKKHDQIMGSHGSLDSMDIPTSVHTLNEIETESQCSGTTARTSDSFASTFTTCTNVSFSKFINHFNGQSVKQKEMLAVLAGITDAIKTSGGTESTVEYFAALMTTLEQMKDESERNNDTISAILSLLSMCIKGVPRPILQLKYSVVSKIISSYWELYAESDDNVILQSIMKCLARLLMVQEAAMWNDSSTVSIYNRILMFIVHSKPKIRKAAQHAICSILKGSLIFQDNSDIVFHPMAKRTGAYCLESLDNCISIGEVTQTLHILLLLQQVLVTFHENHVKNCCELMLKLMTLGNMLVTSCCLRTLHEMLRSRPDVKRFSVELNVNLITALYDYQPSVSNSQLMLAWSMVMQESFTNLSKNDLSQCIVNLPKFMNICTEAIKSGNTSAINDACFIMEILIKDCIKPASTSDNIDKYSKNIQDMFTLVEDCLQPSCCDAWRQVLSVISSFIVASGETCQDFMMPSLKKLASYRDREDFPYNNILDRVFASAIQVIGPELIMQEIPIQVVFQGGRYEFKRSWLLPIMKDNIKKATLKCFSDSFLPIATYCWNVRSSLRKTGTDSVPAVCYDLLQCQIWALLPSFCAHATDISTTFPIMAKALGTTLRTRKDLSITILSSLRRLIKRDEENEKDLETVAKFAKNYLPILFNIYTTPTKSDEDEAIRSSAFKTIEAYLTITDNTIRSNLYDNALKKLESSEEVVNRQFAQKSIFDLIILLLPYQSSDSIRTLYDSYIAVVLKLDDRQQKKRFRLLQTILNAKTESCQMFVRENVSTIQQFLMDALHEASVITRGARIRCLTGLLDYDTSKSTMIEITPEAVLGCKDLNSQCRKSSMLLLVKLYNVASQTGEGTDFMNCVMAGLVGSVTMIKSTLVALTSLTFYFKDKIDTEQLNTMLKSVCLLCSSSTREIVGHALSFVKSAITTFPNCVSNNLPMIIKSLSSVTERCRNGLRRRLHFIYVRLVRRYGVDTITSFVPNEDQKTLRKLRTIRKSQNRSIRKAAENAVLREDSKKKQHQQSDDNRSEFSFKSGSSKVKTMDDILAECDDSDDDYGDDEDEDVNVGTDKKRNKQMKKKRGSNSAAGISIREDPDSIVDFTDNTINKNITVAGAADGNKKTGRSRISKPKKKDVGGFKLAGDGRLIITEDAEVKGSRKQMLSDDGDSVNNDGDRSNELSDMLSQMGVSVKRKAESVISKDSDAISSRYRPGGSGIHRNTKTKKSKVENDKHLGTAYRTSKAKGDMKKKGLPDPFAYIPLKRSMLNKRKRKKASTEFKNIVSGAKKGAAIGLKRKANRNKSLRNVKFH